MEITVQTQVGSVVYRMVLDEKSEMDTLHKAIVLGNPPKYCDACHNKEHFKLASNKDTEGNTYVNVVCLNCFANSKLGLYKSGGYFWHKFIKYQKPSEASNAS